MVGGDFWNRPVWITGAGSGIGRALVRQFLSLLGEGAKVLAIDIDAGALDDLSRETELLGFRVDTLLADVGDRRSYLGTLEKEHAVRGAPGVMINNAGIAKVGSFSELGLEAFEKVLRVNFDGVVTGTAFALPRMEEAGGGLIVNMASLAGHLPAAFMTSYSASKFAVVGFTRALQAELRMSRSPVRACLVSPGFVETPIMEQEGAPFPWYMRWLVSKPGETAREILRGLKAGRSEIYPDAGGRLMKSLHAVAPGWTVESSRLLLARTLSQLVGAQPIRAGTGARRP